MKTILVLLLACGTAGAQECPKYQHPHTHVVYPTICPAISGGCMGQEVVDDPLSCVDDLHAVTEKEWQELQERLAEHEHIMAETRQAIQDGAMVGGGADWRVAKEAPPITGYALSRCNSSDYTSGWCFVMYATLGVPADVYPEQPQQTALVEDDLYGITYVAPNF